MKITIWVAVIFFLSLWSCKKDIPKELDANIFNNDSALNVIWKMPKPAGMGQLSDYTGLNGSTIAFAISESNGSLKDVIIGLDKNTGKEVWRVNKSFYLPSYFSQADNRLFFQAGEIAYAIDLNNGIILWEAKCPYVSMKRSTNLNYEGGKLWIGWKCGDPYAGDSCIIFSIDPWSGALKRIHGWNGADNNMHNFFFSQLKVWIHPNGDSILILNSGSLNWNTNVYKADFIAWNLKTDTAYIDIRGYPGWDAFVNPLIIGDDIILNNQWQNVISMNLKTLKINWQIFLPELNKGCGFKYINGLIMTTPSRNKAIAFIDPLSGSIKNTVTDIGSEWDRYHFKDNFVYFAGSHKIYKVDWSNPKLIWSFESPDNSHKGYTFRKHMALDAVNDLIYTTDNGNFYCFKINK